MVEESTTRTVQEELTIEGQQSAAESADVDEMQTELAELRRQVAESEAREKGRRHRGRRWAVGLLILLGCILLAGANITSWVRGVVLDTDTWAATVGPLTKNDVIVDAISLYVVGEMFDALDVGQMAQEALPAEVRPLSGPLVGVLQDLVHDAVATIIQSDQFNAVWVALNRTIHGIVMAVLRGEGDLLYLRDGQLTVDFSDLLGFVEGALDLKALGLFDDEGWGKVVLLESHQVAALQQAVSIIDTVGVVLPLLALATLLIAWLVSLWRRSTVLWIGIGVAVTMGLSLILFALVQPMVLAYIADPLMRTVSQAVLDVVIRGLVIQTILLLLIGLLLAGGAALAGPHPRAVAIRTTVGGWFESGSAGPAPEETGTEVQ